MALGSGDGEGGVGDQEQGVAAVAGKAPEGAAVAGMQGNNLSLLVGSMELEPLEFQTEQEQSRCKAEILTDEKWRL